jgi:hypothetical protein
MVTNVTPLPSFAADGSITGFHTVPDELAEARELAAWHDAAEPVRHFSVELDEANVYPPVPGGFITDTCVIAPTPDTHITYRSGRHYDTVREFMPFPHEPICWYLIHGDDGVEYAVKAEAMIA